MPKTPRRSSVPTKRHSTLDPRPRPRRDPTARAFDLVAYLATDLAASSPAVTLTPAVQEQFQTVAAELRRNPGLLDAFVIASAYFALAALGSGMEAGGLDPGDGEGEAWERAVQGLLSGWAEARPSS